MKSDQLQPLFSRLREILLKHEPWWTVTEDSARCYGLAGGVGPAALEAWGGKMKKPRMPIASVQMGKNYVSLHLMGLYGNKQLVESFSPELQKRLHGKTCLNFKTRDETLFQELEGVAERAIDGFKKAGFAIPSK